MPWLVDLLYFFVGLVTSPVWLYRLLHTGKWRTDWPGRFGRCRLAPDPRPTILIHAVSVGEVNAVRLLVQRLAERTAGEWRIVISTTTDTGTARAKQLYEPAHRVVRYPLDFSRIVKRFLNTVRPDVVTLVELEVWPNFVRECTKRGVPVCVVNGRLTQRSYGRYRIIGGLLRKTFARLAAVAVQTPDYAERFIGLGARSERVQVLDTMKWDTALVADDVPGSDGLARAMGIDRTRPVIVAGSTAPGEDELLINTCPEDAQLVIVPRKPEWFDLVLRHTPDAVRRTEHPDDKTRVVDGRRIFLLDTVGELRKAYALADVVIVGRSFLGLYGSDMMEPIALGKPTIVGPFHADFADTVAALRAGDGIIVTDQPGEAAARLLVDRPAAAALAERGRRVILSRQGATERHVEMLLSLIPRSTQTAASRGAK